MASSDAMTTRPDPIEAGQVNSATDRRTLAIALYSIVIVLYWISQYVYAATLPSYVQSKTGSLASVGLILSMYGLWQAVVRVPVGICADWIGWRKPFILSGLILSGVGAWVLASSKGADGLV